MENISRPFEVGFERHDSTSNVGNLDVDRHDQNARSGQMLHGAESSRAFPVNSLANPVSFVDFHSRWAAGASPEADLQPHPHQHVEQLQNGEVVEASVIDCRNLLRETTRAGIGPPELRDSPRGATEGFYASGFEVRSRGTRYRWFSPSLNMYLMAGL